MERKEKDLLFSSGNDLEFQVPGAVPLEPVAFRDFQRKADPVLVERATFHLDGVDEIVLGEKKGCLPCEFSYFD